eukprot:36011_1
MICIFYYLFFFFYFEYNFARLMSMVLSQTSISWICLLINCCVYSIDLYVSRYGNDNNSCNNTDEACGTLYGVSLLYGSNNHPYTVHIIDGQNVSLINSYKNNTNLTYHPCVPIPTKISHKYSQFSLMFDFNSTFIKNMTNWYPNECNQIHTATNTAFFEFKFQGTLRQLDSFTNIWFNNLIIDHYIFNNNPFISAISGVERTAIYCDGCAFYDIYALSTSNHYSFIELQPISSVSFSNTTFDNINLQNYSL